MLRDGRWFWWVVVGCLTVLVADVTELGPFAETQQRQEVEVLGDSVDREPVSTTTTSTSTTTVSTTSTTQSEADALEELEGLDPETLDSLEDLRGVDPAALTTTTSPRG